MNAPMPVKSIDNLEMYGNLLTDSFIIETQERHQQIQENKQETLTTTEKVKTHCHNMSKELNVLMSEFQKGSSTFDRLAKASKINAEMLAASSAQIRDSLEKMRRSNEQREITLKGIIKS